MATPIPRFYRVFFATVDPAIAFSGFVNYLLARPWFLESFAPNPTVPPTTETRLFLDTLAGYFAGTILLQVYLLRARPADLVVWKSLQACLLCVDIAMLGGYARAFSGQSVKQLTKWRFEAWSQIAVLAGLAVVRTAFVLGVGLSTEAKKKRK